MVDVRRTPCAVAKEIAPTRTGDTDWEDNSPRRSAVKNLSLRGEGRQRNQSSTTKAAAHFSLDRFAEE